jgi:ParB family chromosome partitioning protein
MSLKELKTKSSGALADASSKPASTLQHNDGAPRRPVTAPGAAALMQPTIDALNERAKKAEMRAAELEERVKDLESTELPVAELEPNPWQPRRKFNQVAMEELANSISQIGLRQAIAVRRIVPPLDTGVQYQIIYGERRWRAHKLLGKASIEAKIVEASDEEMAIWALAENVDREDLEDYEVACAIRNAESQFQSRTRMADALGIVRSDFYRFLDFFKLPDFVLSDLECNPDLMSRRSASEVHSALQAGGDEAIERLRSLWVKVVERELPHSKLAASLAASQGKSSLPAGERDIRKLFIGKEQAGSITRDKNALTVKIRTAALSPSKEQQLREFVENLFKG